MNEKHVELLAEALREAWHWDGSIRSGVPDKRVAERLLASEPFRSLLDGVREEERAGIRATHGRHCPCSACAREDWSNPNLAPCGMHGPSCPPVYAAILDRALGGRSEQP